MKPSYEQLLADNKKLTEQNALWREQVEYITGNGTLEADLAEAVGYTSVSSRAGIRELSSRLAAHAERFSGFVSDEVDDG